MQKIRYVPPVEVVTHRLKTTVLNQTSGRGMSPMEMCVVLLAHLSLWNGFFSVNPWAHTVSIIFFSPYLLSCLWFLLFSVLPFQFLCTFVFFYSDVKDHIYIFWYPSHYILEVWIQWHHPKKWPTRISKGFLSIYTSLSCNVVPESWQ